jgi:hypothetical protein
MGNKKKKKVGLKEKDGRACHNTNLQPVESTARANGFSIIEKAHSKRDGL